jgi:hypothetical protein
MTNWNTHLADNINDILNPPRISCFHPTDQSVAIGQDTLLSFGSERYKVGITHDTGTPWTFTVQVAGLYLIGARLAFSENPNGRRIMRIVEGTGLTNIARKNKMAVAFDLTYIDAVTEWPLAAGQSVSVYVQHNADVALVIPRQPNASAEFWMRRVA